MERRGGTMWLGLFLVISATDYSRLCATSAAKVDALGGGGTFDVKCSRNVRDF